MKVGQMFLLPVGRRCEGWVRDGPRWEETFVVWTRVHGYSTWDLILASCHTRLLTKREMKEKGRDNSSTTVVLGVGYKESAMMGRRWREKSPVWTRKPSRKPSILLVLTIMSSSGAKRPLNLLALGKWVLFSLFTMPVSNYPGQMEAVSADFPSCLSSGKLCTG